MLTFIDLQNEVKRRATRDQAGTQYDIPVKNAVNASLLRVAREAPWRVLRRKGYFTTKNSYTTSTSGITVTNSSTAATLTGATLITDGVEVGRRIQFGTDSSSYIIRQISSESTVTVDRAYEGTTSTGTSYEILPQQEYNLPIQAGHRMFLWHEDYGYPYKMTYVPDQSFFETSSYETEKNTPTHYRMWGENMAKVQVHTNTYIGIYSSASADTAIDVTVAGTVADYPDSEKITTNASNGATVTTGTKLFSQIERVSKDASTTGRISVTNSDTSTTLAVIPVGDVTAGILYKKVQVWPLPVRVFDVNCHFYKDPYRLVADEDIHEMGQDFDEAIILMSVAKIKYESEQEEGDRFYDMYEDEIKSLRRVNMDKIDWFPVLQRPGGGRRDFRLHPNLLYRQVGPNYGPSSR